MKMNSNSEGKIDLSGVDPDHAAWLREEAHRAGMTIDELVTAHRLGQISLAPKCDYVSESRLAEFVKVNLEISPPKVRMALKRQAAHHQQTPEEYAAEAFISILAGDEDNCDVDPLTGAITKDWSLDWNSASPASHD
jgi:hypothetical protein